MRYSPLFRLAGKNIIHHPVLNFLLLVQMIAVYFIAISISSSVESRFYDYLPFQTILASNGEFFNMIYAQDPDTGYTLNKELLLNHLQGSPQIYATYDVWVQYNGSSGHDHYISYDDALLQCYQPELESGKWFPKELNPTEPIPVVISQNNYGLKEGDLIILSPFGTEIELKAKVIGVLKEGASYINCTHPKNDAFSAKNLYTNYYYAIEESVLFILPQSVLQKYNTIITQMHGPMFIEYDSAEQENNHKFLIQLNNSFNSSLLSIKNNSINYIFEQCKLLLPIMICCLLFSIIGALSINALMTKRRMKTFGILYICGLKWKGCEMISVISSFVIGGFALIITLLATVLLDRKGLLASTVVNTGWIQLVSALGIFLIYELFSFILPALLINSKTPKQVLYNN